MQRTRWMIVTSLVAALAVAVPAATADVLPGDTTGIGEGVTGSTSTGQGVAGSTAAGATGATSSTSSGAARSATPIVAKLRLSVNGAERIKRRHYVLPRQLVTISGELSLYEDGQEVTVTIKRGGRSVLKRSVVVKQVGDTGTGSFRLKFRARRGRHAVGAALTKATAVTAADPKPAKLIVVSPGVSRGARGVGVQVIQRKLKRLGYVTPRSGRFDDGTGRALLAFRKVNGLARTQSAGSVVTRKLAAGKGRFRLKRPKAGRHIEVDLSRQVMVLADRGKVQRIYHVSTGASATPTILGTFRVYRKDPGTNAKGMVHSSYFIRGYAVHGFNPVPTYPASHGCVRVPIPNAMSIFRWVRMGTRVDVYR